MLLGGSRKAMEMMRWPSASRLPVRRKNGTPAQRQLSIEHFSAMKVSVSDSGIDAVLGPIAGVLPADHVLRVDRQHAAKDLVLFLADRPRLQRRRWFHRHEGENLEQMGDDHVAIRSGRLVERRTFAEPERLGNVDLHVIDEVAVPDRLEQPVGEAECEDVLRRLLAEEVIDAEI